MTLGDDIAAELPGLRAHAESRMADKVRVRRPVGSDPDPLTGIDVPTFAPEDVYAGPCRVKAVNVQTASVDSAGSTVTTQARELHTPWDSPEILPGDVAFMDDLTYTPRLRGVVYRVNGAHESSDTTAQRVPVTRLGVPNA